MAFRIEDYSPRNASVLAGWMSLSAFDLFLVSSRLAHPVSAEDFEAYRKRSSSAAHRFYAAYLSESGTYAGHFEMKNIDPHHGNGTGAHVCLSPDLRGKGLGRPFIESMIETGFSRLGLSRLGLSVHTVNASAVAAYLRSGFRFEGTIREVLDFEGHRYSLYQMSILRREWEEDR